MGKIRGMRVWGYKVKLLGREEWCAFERNVSERQMVGRTHVVIR